MAPSLQTEAMLLSEANSEGTESGAAPSDMRKTALPGVLGVSTANFTETKKNHQIVVVAYLSPDDKRTEVIFAAFVDKYKGQFVFGVSFDATLAGKEGVDRPSVVVYKAFDERKAIYPNGRDFEGLDDWFRVTSKPLIGEIDEDTYPAYKQDGIPLACILIGDREERDQLAEQFRPVAKTFRGRINIGTIDARLHGETILKIKPKIRRRPLLVVEDFPNGKQHTYNPSKPLLAQDTALFLQNVLDSPESPVAASPAVSTQNVAVSVVKAWNYREIVIDSKQDVFIGIYAPWCPRCQSRAQVFYQLGSLYAEHTDKATIAKVDGTIHDVPVNVDHLPTFLLYPGDRRTPLDCSGFEHLEDFVTFIKERGSHNLEVSIPPEWRAKRQTMDHS